MKEFKVLPTNKDFLALSDKQIEFIAYSMEKDREEIERARRGGIADADYQDYEQDWWFADHDDFVALHKNHNEEDIAKQVQAMTTPEDMAKLRARWDASIEADSIVANGGTTVEEDTINELMQNNLERVIKEAKNLEAHGVNKWGDKTDIEVSEDNHAEQLGFKKLTKEGIDEAIAIFENVGADDGFDPIATIPSREDDFYI